MYLRATTRSRIPASSSSAHRAGSASFRGSEAASFALLPSSSHQAARRRAKSAQQARTAQQARLHLRYAWQAAIATQRAARWRPNAAHAKWDQHARAARHIRLRAPLASTVTLLDRQRAAAARRANFSRRADRRAARHAQKGHTAERWRVRRLRARQGATAMQLAARWWPNVASARQDLPVRLVRSHPPPVGRARTPMRQRWMRAWPVQWASSSPSQTQRRALRAHLARTAWKVRVHRSPAIRELTRIAPTLAAPASVQTARKASSALSDPPMPSHALPASSSTRRARASARRARWEPSRMRLALPRAAVAAQAASARRVPPWSCQPTACLAPTATCRTRMASPNASFAPWDKLALAARRRHATAAPAASRMLRARISAPHARGENFRTQPARLRVQSARLALTALRAPPQQSSAMRARFAALVAPPQQKNARIAPWVASASLVRTNHDCAA
jgi:hypothetical protein